jgi:hypothetical protein
VLTNGDRLVKELSAGRELTALERANIVRAGALTDRVEMLEQLMREPLTPSQSIALSSEISKCQNALHKVMHEIRQIEKRRDRQQEQSGGPPVMDFGSGPAPQRRAQLHAAVRSSRERTQRLRAALVERCDR